MFKIKKITSLLAVVAVLFGFATESFAAKKSKTLKNTIKQVLLSVVFLKVFQDFQMLMHLEIGLVLTLMYVEQLLLQY